MDFARKILQNFGWKDGDGLGKNNDGIAKPLSATLKFDKAGFGADQAEADFNNHWWERVFNEAATNVNITKEGEQIKLALKNEEDSVEISTKSYSAKKLKKLRGNHTISNDVKSGYNNFLQAATLNNIGDEVENPNKVDINDIEVSRIKVLTDEELFKACGGRTGHKGARHGLKLSGKLSRIQQQEEELLARMKAKPISFRKEQDSKQKLDITDKRKEEAADITHCGSIENDLVNRKCKSYKITNSETSANSGTMTTIESKRKKRKLIVNNEGETNKNHMYTKFISETDLAKKEYIVSENTDQIIHNKRKKRNKHKYTN